MDISGIIKESALTKTIQIGSNTGQHTFATALSNQWSSTPAEIQYRSDKFRSFRSTLHKNPSLSKKLDTFFNAYNQSENILDEIIKPPTEESTESKSQLVFTSQNLRPLNFAPLLLTILYVVKIIITPLFALCMPLILVIAPYFLVKYMYNMDITFGMYWRIIQDLVFKPQSTMMEKLQRLGHIGWVFVGIGQNMLQPILTARHVYSLNSIYAKYFETTQNLYVQWRSILEDFSKSGWNFSDKSYSGWFDQFCTDPRMFLAGSMEPLALKCWIREVGEMHVLYRFASDPYVNPINVIQLEQPYLKLRGAYDPQIQPPDARKLINIDSSKGEHSLLTGPNRGGKSTVLRATLMNVLLAQTYGVCFAEECSLAPFKWIHSCLRLEDIPGAQSFFEREVFMAARSLRRLANTGNGLILIDELFHSTNPSDSNRAAKLYTKQIWESHKCLTLISTHDFDLARSAPTNIRRLCCAATRNEDDSIEYSYQLGEGICEVSSVDEILRENHVI